MKNYELVFVVKPNADEEVRTAVLNKVKEVIATEGEVEKVDVWGTKKLMAQDTLSEHKSLPT